MSLRFRARDVDKLYGFYQIDKHSSSEHLGMIIVMLTVLYVNVQLNLHLKLFLK